MRSAVRNVISGRRRGARPASRQAARRVFVEGCARVAARTAKKARPEAASGSIPEKAQ